MLLCFNEKVAARSWDQTIVTTTAVIASLKANLCSFRLLRESSLELTQFVKTGEFRWNGIVRDRSNFKTRKSPSLFSFWAFVRIAVCENYKNSLINDSLLQGQENNNPQRSHGIPNGGTYPQIPSLVPGPWNAATEFVTRSPAKHGRLKWVRTCHLSCLFVERCYVALLTSSVPISVRKFFTFYEENHALNTDTLVSNIQWW